MTPLDFLTLAFALILVIGLGTALGILLADAIANEHAKRFDDLDDY